MRVNLKSAIHSDPSHQLVSLWEPNFFPIFWTITLVAQASWLAKYPCRHLSIPDVELGDAWQLQTIEHAQTTLRSLSNPWATRKWNITLLAIEWEK